MSNDGNMNFPLARAIDHGADTRRYTREGVQEYKELDYATSNQ